MFKALSGRAAVALLLPLAMIGLALGPVTEGSASATASLSTPPSVLNPFSPSSDIVGTAEVAAAQALESYAITEVLNSHGLPPTDGFAVLGWGRDDIRAAEFAALAAIIDETPATRAGVGLLGGGQDQIIYNWFQNAVQKQQIADATQAINEFFRWSGFTSLNTTYNPLNFGSPQSYPGGYGNGAPVPTGYCTFLPPGGSDGPFANTYSAQNAEDCYITCTDVITDCFPPEPTVDQFEQWGKYDAEQPVLGSPDYLPAAAGAVIAEGAGVAAAIAGFTTPIGKIVSGSSPLLVKFASELAPYAARPLTLVGAAASQAAARAAAVATKAAAATVTEAVDAADVAATALSVSLITGIVGVVIDFIVSTVLAGITLNQQLTEPQKLQAVLTSAQNTPPDLAKILASSGGTSELLSAFVATTLPEAQIQCSVNPQDDCYTPTTPPPHGGSDPSFLVTQGGSSSGAIQSTIYSVDPEGLYFNNTYMSGNGWFVTQRFNAYDPANATSPTDGGATVESLSFPFTDWSGNKWSAQRVTDASGVSQFALTPLGAGNAGACALLPDGTSPCLTSTLQILVPGSGGVPYEATVRVLSAQSLKPTVNVSYSTPAVAGNAITFSPDAVDPSGRSVTYTWSFPLSGGQTCLNPPASGYCTIVTSTSGPTTWTFLVAGDYEASVDAVDTAGYSTTEQFSVAVTSTTSTVVSSSAAPSVSTQPVTFTATVTPAGGGVCNNFFFGPFVTGYVQFALDGVDYGNPEELLLNNCSFNNKSASVSVTIPNLGVDLSGHAVTATYLGNQTYYSSTSAVLSQVVDPESDTTTVSSSIPTIVFGQPVTFKAAVVPVAPGGARVPTGTVQFYAAGSPLGGAVAVGPDGTATSPTTTSLQVNQFDPGLGLVTAVYSGDGTFPSTTGQFVENVTPDPTLTTISSSVNPSEVGQPVTFTAHVAVPAPGSGTPSGCVQFAVDGTDVGSPVTLDGSGTATLPAVTSMALTGAGSSYPNGHDVTATYLLLDDTCQDVVLSLPYETSSGSLTQTVNPPTVVVASATPPPLLSHSPFKVKFSGPVAGVSTANFTVSPCDCGTVIPGTVACSGASGTPVNCSTGPVLSARFTPMNPLIAGEFYLVLVDYSGTSIVSDPGGVPVPKSFTIVRAQTQFSAFQYPLSYKWAMVKNAAAQGGSYVEERYPGATQSFQASGASVGIVTWNAPDGGTAAVKVTTPNQPTITKRIDTYAPVAGDHTATISALPAGTHTVTVTVNGAQDASSTGSWVRIDATVVGGVQKPSPKLTSLWPNYPTDTYTGSKGASLTLQFSGTGVQWTAITGPNDGRAKVTIDGATVATEDLYAPGGYGYTTYTFGGLADTGHTVVISALGTKDASSSDVIVTVAGLTVQ